MSEQNCRGNIDKEKEIEIDWEKKYITTRVRNEMESMWEVILFIILLTTSHCAFYFSMK